MAPIKTKAKNLDMTQGEPARLLVLFAIPMLIGGIFQLMYNMTDTLVVGRFASVDALAAIGATGSTTSKVSASVGERRAGGEGGAAEGLLEAAFTQGACSTGPYSLHQP